MELQLKAKHFKYTRFSSPCNCAIAKAAKEKFNTTAVKEQMSTIIINGVEYTHERYNGFHFILDREKAVNAKFSNEIIRTVILNKSNF